MAALEHCLDRRAELLAAAVALVEARPGRSTFQRPDAVGAAAVRAHRTMRPHDAFQLCVGGGLIVEVQGGKNAGHVRILVGFGSLPFITLLALNTAARLRPSRKKYPVFRGWEGEMVDEAIP